MTTSQLKLKKAQERVISLTECLNWLNELPQSQERESTVKVLKIALRRFKSPNDNSLIVQMDRETAMAFHEFQSKRK